MISLIIITTIAAWTLSWLKGRALFLICMVALGLSHPLFMAVPAAAGAAWYAYRRYVNQATVMGHLERVSKWRPALLTRKDAETK